MNEPYLFEVSWEVCNKVGGIYTVIKSKLAETKSHFPTYFTVGPYFKDKAAAEFDEQETPGILIEPFKVLQNVGVFCHYGKWLADTEVDTILIDFSGFTSQKNDIKAQLWEKFGIDSLYTSYYDFDEPIIWATAVGKLIGQVALNAKVIAHCHEWLAGATLLYLKSIDSKVATVFTTHATVVGRALSAQGVNVYAPDVSIDLTMSEYKTSIAPKHQVEQQSAIAADVFTTVSPITALEAEHFLGKKPDKLLLNGLNISKFPTFEESSIRHQRFKSKIKEFMLYYFLPYYPLDVDNTLIYFLASRNEFKAKGIDIFVKSLGQLNKKLIEEKSNISIVSFLFVPANAQVIRSSLSEDRTFFRDIKESILDEEDTIMRRLLTSVIAKRSSCDESYLLGENLVSELKKKLLRFKRSSLPPLSTHLLHDESNDPIISSIKAAELFNRQEDRVKIIYYPVYLTGTDDVLDLGYYESMQGSHLGVFPSLYEPWGYTPVEAAALGVPSITTDLSGFGRYIGKQTSKKKNPGIFVINRLGKSDDSVITELTTILHKFSHSTAQERIKNKIEAKRIAAITDWSVMIKNYLNAYEMALGKAYGT